MKKKVLALFLSAALCVTLLPATGMAAEFGSGDAEIVENAANSQEMFSAEETTEPMGETEQPAEDSMEEETAEATSTSDPELTVTPAVTPTADPEPTVTPTVTPTPVPKINVKWTGEKWVSRSSVNVTLQVDANGACYYKAAARKKDGTSDVPKLDMGNSHVAVTTDRSFVIYLKNLDIEKEFDLYLKVLGSDGRTSNLKKLKLNYRGTRPKYDVTPTPAYTPKVYNSRDSVLRGLESPLKFTPNTFYEFTVIGAGTTNTNPGPGDVKWVPVYWSTATNPTYSQMHTAWKIGSAKGINKAATYNLYVFFAKYTYTGGQWQETDRIESVRYQFRSAAITTVKLTTPGLSGTSNSPAGIVFKWKKAANASGYKIYRRTGNSSKWVNIATVSGSNTLVYTDGSVKAGTMYTYTVRAYKGSALSAYNKNGSRIVRLTAPVQYKPSSKASGKLTVRWKKAVGASGYQIQYAASRSMRGARTVSTSALTRTLSGLKKGSTYYVRIRAYKKSERKDILRCLEQCEKCKSKKIRSVISRGILENRILCGIFSIVLLRTE